VSRPLFGTPKRPADVARSPAKGGLLQTLFGRKKRSEKPAEQELLFNPYTPPGAPSAAPVQTLLPQSGKLEGPGAIGGKENLPVGMRASIALRQSGLQASTRSRRHLAVRPPLPGVRKL
jgi:hypothetical protein